ncbi:MAG: alpha/beta hydrolase [Rhizobiaceae bacterium]|nr:alpha/beta hydrolase [Rhizobiaceae bacterium]
MQKQAAMALSTEREGYPWPDISPLFPGFTERTIDVCGGGIRTLVGGQGDPLLLLHGHPETLVQWQSMAGELARSFTVVMTDLRGYGRSWKPETTADHEPYTKRAMAREQVLVMRELGHERFAFIGHDRGARVGHRMALDWPDVVQRMTLIDIVPTASMYGNVTRELATALCHWFLAIQPYPFPEKIIGGARDTYLDAILFGLSKAAHPYSETALAEYRAAYNDASIHAMCEDYRAGATTDLEHDAADADARIRCPLQVLWGKHSPAGRFFDPMAVWRTKALDVVGRQMDCGHFIPEELPAELLAEIVPFHSNP